MIQLIRFNFARKFVPVSRDKLSWFIFNRVDGSALSHSVLVVLMVVIMVVLVVDFFVDFIGLVVFSDIRLSPGFKVAVSGGLFTLSMSSKSSYSSSKYEVTLLWLWVSHLVISLVRSWYFKVQLSWIQNRLITCDDWNDVDNKVRLVTLW